MPGYGTPTRHTQDTQDAQDAQTTQDTQEKSFFTHIQEVDRLFAGHPRFGKDSRWDQSNHETSPTPYTRKAPVTPHEPIGYDGEYMWAEPDDDTLPTPLTGASSASLIPQDHRREPVGYKGEFLWNDDEDGPNFAQRKASAEIARIAAGLVRRSGPALTQTAEDRGNLSGDQQSAVDADGYESDDDRSDTTIRPYPCSSDTESARSMELYTRFIDEARRVVSQQKMDQTTQQQLISALDAVEPSGHQQDDPDQTDLLISAQSLLETCTRIDAHASEGALTHKAVREISVLTEAAISLMTGETVNNDIFDYLFTALDRERSKREGLSQTSVSDFTRGAMWGTLGVGAGSILVLTLKDYTDRWSSTESGS